MPERVLIVFVKNLIPGKVKTRLAADIGTEEALRVYRKLLTRTQRIVSEVNTEVFIYFSDFIPEDDLWAADNYQKCIQKGVDLGERMYRAISELAQSHREIVLIGSDCPDLNSNMIHDAFDAMRYVDVVIGPATDGGYYLIGMHQAHGFLFKEIAWSTSSVFTTTRDRMIAGMLNFQMLPVLDDVDTVTDLYRTGLMG